MRLAETVRARKPLHKVLEERDHLAASEIEQDERRGRARPRTAAQLTEAQVIAMNNRSLATLGSALKGTSFRGPRGQ